MSILAALLRGVLAVSIGQVLSVYKSDIQKARRLRSYLEYMRSFRSRDDENTYPKNNALGKARDSAEDVYMENTWLLTEEGEQALFEIFYELEEVKQGLNSDDSISENWDRIENHIDVIDSDMAHIRIRDGFYRYLGNERPYPKHSEMVDQTEQEAN